MSPNFSENLNQAKKSLGLTQVELCQVLFNVPHRTLQSWLQGEKEPPMYVQKLILFRLNGLLISNSENVNESL